MDASESKSKVLAAISMGNKPIPLPKAKWLIGIVIVHVRYRSSPKSRGTVYSFNINPNTLTADFEIWICGDATRFFVFPIDVMRTIYDDPDSYPDYTHPSIRIAEVDVSSRRLLFGRGGKDMDASRYYGASLGDFL